MSEPSRVLRSAIVGFTLFGTLWTAMAVVGFVVIAVLLAADVSGVTIVWVALVLFAGPFLLLPSYLLARVVLADETVMIRNPLRRAVELSASDVVSVDPADAFFSVAGWQRMGIAVFIDRVGRRHRALLSSGGTKAQRQRNHTDLADWCARNQIT